MRFVVRGPRGALPANPRDAFLLLTDNWDDWFKYSTQYFLQYVDSEGRTTDIGSVKIGEMGMQAGQRRPNIPSEFAQLGSQFFSVGQDASYYETLRDLGEGVAEDVAQSLRDIAASQTRLKAALKEDVTHTSLLRSVSRSTIEGQFRRILSGGTVLSEYSFDYVPPARGGSSSVRLTFEVKPNSFPPTNVHVLIGRNAVGKTTLLNNMTRAIVLERVPSRAVGKFITSDTEETNRIPFANVVSVSFSAFDAFEPLYQGSRRKSLGYTYIGLKDDSEVEDDPFSAVPNKTNEDLAEDFSKSLAQCSREPSKALRWKRALKALEADPIFADARFAELASGAITRQDRHAASRRFERLSSGHKIVLLTITRLVEVVEEKSLVLMDEPEAHLHPPLLSAFVRALSELLVNRNGVAIIATHSPVILQEVPRRCAWFLTRSGNQLAIERPTVETFGENLGVLTREVFGLEVTNSGFHKMIADVAENATSYDDVLQAFDGQLGGEGKALARALLAVVQLGRTG